MSRVRKRLPYIDDVPDGAVVFGSRTYLERMFHALPVAVEVAGLPLRYTGALLDVAEDALAELSAARSASRTVWDLYGEFASELPDPALTKVGRMRAAAAGVLVRWARRAATDFGPTGFCGDAAVWASWLASQHAELSEYLAAKTARVLPVAPADGQVWRGGELLGRVRTEGV